MSESVLRGLAAAGGVAVGQALVLSEPEPEANGAGGPAAQEAALAALTRVAAELGRTADQLRADGRLEEAEIFEANRLMAEDPTLAEEIRSLAGERPAGAAILAATERHAAAIAALPDALLAGRAADVRRLGRRAASLAVGVRSPDAPLEPAILVARDLGPADVVDLDLAAGTIRGVALAEGAATSHAAIMARSVGLPMTIALGDELLAAADGDVIVVDGDSGVVVLQPNRETRDRVAAAGARRAREQQAFVEERLLPPVTRDGRWVRLLCNASSAAEAAAGTAAGAEGIGLLRTELAFLEADAWPSEAEHAAALAPVLASAPAGVVTIRTLDFGGDKTPPFLAGRPERGLELMLDSPGALEDQLAAILRVGGDRPLRLLLPLVVDATQVRQVRALIDEPGAAGPPPVLGAMIETPGAVAQAVEIAAEADFLSIGTNDLVQYTLGLDRTRPLATAEAAADPAVLNGIAEVVEAAHAGGKIVEVCGEAAGEPVLVALLVGLGVDELSISPARLDRIRWTIRSLSAEAAADVARRALTSGSAAAAIGLVRELLLELTDELDEAGQGLGGVVA
jgi:phosphoenolpyruvate-protein kinase (PTS system EI component)